MLQSCVLPKGIIYEKFGILVEGVLRNDWLKLLAMRVVAEGSLTK